MEENNEEEPDENAAETAYALKSSEEVVDDAGEPKSSSEINRGSSEVKKGSSDINRGSSEVKKGSSGINRGSSEVKKGSSDINRGSSEAKRSSAEIKKDYSVINKGFPEINNPDDLAVTDNGPRDGGCAGASGVPTFVNFNCRTLLQKRNPFIHDPPQPEERRARIQNPSTPREYIINLREDLADFQESHGLPRTRDYSFLSLGLALAQETARALCSLFLMFIELFPILAIVSLILRFALDKLIEILETTEPAHKLKKAIIFSLQMLLILIPLWIFIGTIIIPLLSLIFSIFKRLFHFKGGNYSLDVPRFHDKLNYPKNGF